MSYDKAVSEHYRHGELLDTIQASLIKSGITIDNITAEDLAPVDEFHIGGRIATDNLLVQLNFSEKDHILDVGCGIGGAARFVANKYNNRVTGVDLTPEYITVGKVLCTWVGLEEQVTLYQGSALSMPFEDETFDGAFMLHVGMNIDDKVKLFNEVYRLLCPGAYFAVYDVMQINDGELTYPVPWATEQTTCRLATPDQYSQALNQANFKLLTENNRCDFALKLFQRMDLGNDANGARPPLGLHTLMKGSAGVKVKNMIDSIKAGLIAPFEIICQK